MRGRKLTDLEREEWLYRESMDRLIYLLNRRTLSPEVIAKQRESVKGWKERLSKYPLQPLTRALAVALEELEELKAKEVQP